MGGLFLLTESRFLSSPIAELRTGPLGSGVNRKNEPVENDTLCRKGTASGKETVF